MLALILEDDELYGCLEYDLRAYCGGMRLAGFWRHEYSVRELIMMLRHLPTESALSARGFAGDDRWGSEGHLIATLTDYVHMLDVHFLYANGAKNLPEPEWVTRPNMELKL